MYLFTGKIAYITKENLLDYPVIWLGNFLGGLIAAVLIRLANPDIQATARTLMQAKLDKSVVQLAALAFFCGVIMYLAVDNYRNSASNVSQVFGIVIGVTVFLLCGFEHSIADMAYAAIGAECLSDALRYLGVILLVSVFNGIGSLSMRYLLKPFRKE
jgi:formate/nitrite transporter FocA (FNT family)